MHMQTEVVVALIVSSLALIGAVINAMISAKNSDLNVLREIIIQLKEKIKEIECENKDLKDWAERLVGQVKQAGLTPVEFIKHEYLNRE